MVETISLTGLRPKDLEVIPYRESISDLAEVFMLQQVGAFLSLPITALVSQIKRLLRALEVILSAMFILRSLPNKSTAQGLGNNWVFAVFIDLEDNIYAATLGGLSISTDNGISFSNKTTSQGLGNDNVRGVYVDSSGTIYAATAAGLSISYDGGSNFINKSTDQGIGTISANSVFIMESSNTIYVPTNYGISVHAY